MHWVLSRQELISGNLTISVSKFEVSESIRITRKALPVNDIYVLDFVMPERRYSRQFGQDLFHSVKAANHFGFSSATIQLSQITDPGPRFHHIEIYISRSYLIRCLDELDFQEHTPTLARLEENEQIFQLLTLENAQEKIIHRLLDLFRTTAKPPKMLINNLTHQLLISFSDQVRSHQHKRIEIAEKPDYKKIYEAKELIESDINRKFKLDEMCRFCNMSPTKFKKLFKSILGKSFTDYYTSVRMELAIKLLQGGKVESLTELSMQLGYKTLSQFTRAFKSYYKSSPAYFFDMRKKQG